MTDGTFPVVRLAEGRERSLLRRHVWVFSGAVAAVEGGPPTSGATVRVTDSRGRFLAWAAWSEQSQLTARVWSFDENERIDAAFFRRRVAAAGARRTALGLADPAGGCRLIYSESDGLPGVIVDRYGEFAVLQLLSAGAELHRGEICDALEAEFGFRGVYERSDVAVRSKEGLAPRQGRLRGAEPPETVVIEEDGARYAVDLRHGQKTGFYFDLREARKVVARYAAGRRMLNAFCYTGAFAVAALRAGAGQVLNLDSSRPALDQALRNLELNGLADGRAELRRCDVFTELRQLAAANRRFDLIVLDPPKLIDSKGALPRGCRAYQDLARLGFSLLAPGGILINLSCSGLMDPDLFQKITAAAALEAGCGAAIIGRVTQSADHPVLLTVPETSYLKGIVSMAAY